MLTAHIRGAGPIVGRLRPLLFGPITKGKFDHDEAGYASARCVDHLPESVIFQVPGEMRALVIAPTRPEAVRAFCAHAAYVKQALLRTIP